MPKVTTGIPRFTEDSSQKDDETEESITDDGRSSLTGSTRSKVSSLTLYDGVASYKTFSSGQATPVHEPNNNHLDLPDINDGKSGLALSMGSGNYYLQMATSEHVFVNSGKKEIPIEDEVDQNETSPTQRKIIFVVMAIMDFVGGVIFSMIGPFYPIEAVDRGSDAFTAGVVMGVLQLAIFVASPIWGSQMTRLGARFTYLSGVFFSAGCVALFGLLTGCPDNLFIPMSLLVRFFQGVGCAAYMTATYSILVYNYPGRIATVIGVLETMNGLGFMIGPVIGGVLYQMGGFPTPFFVMAVLSLAVGFSISPIVPKNIGEKQHRKSRNMSLMSLLKIPLILLCGGLHATTAAIVGTLDATLALYLEQFKLPAYLTGFIFICGPGAYVICVPLWGYITDRFSTYRMSFVIVGFTVCACSLLLAGPAPFLPIEPDLKIMVVSLVIMGISESTLVVTISVMFASTIKYGFPQNSQTYSTVSGFIESCYAIGAFSGPIVAGSVYDFVGWRWTITVPALSLLFFVSLLVIYQIYHKCVKMCDDLEDSERKRPYVDSDIDEKSNLISNHSLYDQRTV